MKQKKFLIAAIGLFLIAPSIFAQTFVAGGLQYTIDGDSAVVKANSKADESIKAAGKMLKRGSKTVCSLSTGIYIIDADGISAMKAAVK